MISPAYRKALKILHSRLSASDIEWYITGKTNLALQGIDTEPSHLGVLIHDSDLDRFLEMLSGFERSDVIELKNGEAKEFIMDIGDAKVLVCAEYPHGVYWAVIDNPESLTIDDMQIPCFSLKSEREAYLRLGMLDKARIIDDFLNKGNRQ